PNAESDRPSDGRKQGKRRMAKTPQESENGNADKAAQATKGNGAEPTLNVLAQYVKDLSFESPGAPGSLRGRDKAPGININVNVNVNPLSGSEFDVTRSTNAKASFDNHKDVLVNIEHAYGGVFRIEGFPQEHMLPILFIECPRLLF